MRKALLFDVDGVLADTEALHQRATSLAAGRQIDCSGGGSTQSKLLRAGIPEEQIQKIYSKKQRYYLEAIRSVRRDAVLRELLDRASERYILGACSNSSKDACLQLLFMLGLQSAFSTIVTGGDVGRLKPAPDIYLVALERLEVLAENAVVFEDSHEGVIAAEAAGVPVIVQCTFETLKSEIAKWV